MNFVAQLEDYLRDLGAEARKKHPGEFAPGFSCCGVVLRLARSTESITCEILADG